MQINAVSGHGDKSGGYIAAITGTGTAVELPRVPGTHDCVLMQSAVRQGSAAMGTHAVNSVDLTVHIADRIVLPIGSDLRHASGRQF